MTTLRRFTCDDLFAFNAVNTDALTETYNNPFYLTYLATWPEYCLMAEAPGGVGGGHAGNGHGAGSGSSGPAAGYVLGKAEGRAELWHGHVTAVTVAPERRRQGLARRLMDALEAVAADVDDAFFVDLFVRASNRVAIGMYGGMGYRVYRRVIDYYSGGPLVPPPPGGEEEEEEEEGGGGSGKKAKRRGGGGKQPQTPPPPRRTEDALDMRKAMPRDIHERSVVPLDRPVRPHELEFD
jgi:N-terminal acetyltransferase B complex catalytic subunit